MSSVMAQQSAFATGVLPDIYAFHPYTGNSSAPTTLKPNGFPAMMELSSAF